MISALSRRIVNSLCNKAVIEETDKELYAYGFFVLLSKLFFFIIAIIFGLIFNAVYESTVFFLMFSLIRSYAGGIHAPKEWLCTLFTSVSLFFGIALIKSMSVYHAKYFAFAIIAVSVFFTAIFSPLDTPEKPLSKNEKKFFKIKSFIILFFMVFVSLSAFFFSKTRTFYAVTASLLLECILIAAGKIKQRLSIQENDDKH